MTGLHPEDVPREALDALQAGRLAALARALAGNRFYRAKFAAAGLSPADLRSPADLARLPFTTKAELTADQAEHPPYGTNHSEPPERYCRLHQTSGTSSGRPLRVLDTAEGWSNLVGFWESGFRLMGLRPGDRLFFPFSFGPFLGFWTAFEAGCRLGYLTLTGGGMGSVARLRFLIDNGVTSVFCTPTYALRLAEVAAREGIDLPASPVRMLVVAGEPGGGIPATRRRIESAWGARLFDHNGLTETGPIGVECIANPLGIHVLETYHLVEVIDPDSGRPVSRGEEGELVVTTLCRPATPLLRYRTGDLVRLDPRPCPCGRVLKRLDGGVRGRVDDMITLRGNNVHPSALQAILHRFAEVVEHRLEVDRGGTLAVLRIEVELAPGADAGVLARIDQAIRAELLFRAELRAVPPGSLPRPEMKAQRLLRKNGAGVTETPAELLKQPVTGERGPV
jgi:phenylacetate-CoA ligase